MTLDYFTLAVLVIAVMVKQVRETIRRLGSNRKVRRKPLGVKVVVRAFEFQHELGKNPCSPSLDGVGGGEGKALSLGMCHGFAMLMWKTTYACTLAALSP